MKDEIKEILDKMKMFINPSEWQDIEEWLKPLLDYITNLQEKYERMKENAEILSNGYNELEKRNEKAIEYIEKNRHLNWYVESCYTSDLLKLLEGSDKE